MVSALDYFYATGRTRPIEWRLAQIESAVKMLTDHKDEWVAALEASSMSKPAQEGETTEVSVVIQEARTMAANLKDWIAPIDVATPVALIPASSQVEKQPMGVTLVIGPFNYPVSLALGPMLGAICAGCPVVVKPSDQVPEVAQLLARYVPSYLDAQAIKVVTGGIPETNALLKLKWDNILFTGSERVGRMVAAAAAVHLTPTTLELGGKVCSPSHLHSISRASSFTVSHMPRISRVSRQCPVFIGPSHGPVGDIAKKLVWGRLLNCGQVAAEIVEHDPSSPLDSTL